MGVAGGRCRRIEAGECGWVNGSVDGWFGDIGEWDSGDIEDGAVQLEVRVDSRTGGWGPGGEACMSWIS